jgi:hypothetical protein
MMVWPVESAEARMNSFWQFQARAVTSPGLEIGPGEYAVELELSVVVSQMKICGEVGRDEVSRPSTAPYDDNFRCVPRHPTSPKRAAAFCRG